MPALTATPSAGHDEARAVGDGSDERCLRRQLRPGTRREEQAETQGHADAPCHRTLLLFRRGYGSLPGVGTSVHIDFAMPLKSQTTCPALMVSSHSSFWVPWSLPATAVDEAERSVAQAQHRDVGFGARAQLPEIGPLDDRRRASTCWP